MPNSHATRLVRFTELELRNVVGRPITQPSTGDFLDGLSYFRNERGPFTGRAQSVNAQGEVTAEGFFVEGRPEGAWRRWHRNGRMREEFFITGGMCAYARHWDENGVPI